MSVDLEAYLREVRVDVLAEIRRMVPEDSEFGPILWDLAFDYPLRPAKALRPALCVATCAGCGGAREVALPTAAVFELYHNAFLIHDDVEDGSELRRGEPTLHRAWGTPIAVNVGDALLALTLEPLLENTRVVGLGPALRLLRLIARMARESAEGQALELHWIRTRRWDLDDGDYVRLVRKKTAMYTFVAPMLAGALLAGVAEEHHAPIRAFADALGVAFQIQDDLLNLTASPGRMGKEACGDLWEGKRTLVLLHLLRSLGADERARAIRVLDTPREVKAAADVSWLRERAVDHGSLDHARHVAAGFVAAAREEFSALAGLLPPSAHREFIEGLVNHVVHRLS